MPSNKSIRQVEPAEPLLSFSGTHPMDPAHAGPCGDDWADLARQGICPRCRGPLYPKDPVPTLRRPGDPFPIWHPAGSRVTACRCIPVCDICAFAESVDPVSHLGGVGRQLLEDGDHFFGDREETDRVAAVDGLRYLLDSSWTPVDRWPLDGERLLLGAAVLQAWTYQNMHKVTIPLAQIARNPHPGGWADPDNN
jgi:hypothetical protein